MNQTEALVKSILERPFGFEWSVQGLGMLRTYLGGKQFRLHIWDSSLMVHNVSPMHNHPWDLDSHIVCGNLINQRFTPSSPLSPVSKRFSAVEITCGENACTHGEIEQVWLAPQQPEYYYAGADYQQHAREIHRTRYLDGTVTIVQRDVPTGGNPDRALVLWEGDGPWVDAAPRPAEHLEILRATQKALRQLES